MRTNLLTEIHRNMQELVPGPPPVDLTVKVMFITPYMAEQWLGKNKNFRRKTTTYHERMAHDMTNDDWELNGETIKLDQKGNLRDGQHRLMACVESGKSFWSVVVFGIRDDLTIDEGLSRKLSDWLGHHGVEHYTMTLAAALRHLFSMRRFGKIRASSKDRATVSELVQLWKEEPGLEAFCRVGCGEGVRGLLPASLATCLFYLFDEKDPDRYQSFVQGLSGRDVLSTDEPPVVLHRKLLENRSRKTKYNSNQLAAMTIIAWNHWCLDQKVKMLKWQETGRGAKGFPEIE